MGICEWRGVHRRADILDTSSTLPRRVLDTSRRVDIRAWAQAEEPFALLHLTGSVGFNRSMSRIANALGLSLSEKGLRAAVRSGGALVKTAGGFEPNLRTEVIIYTYSVYYKCMYSSIRIITASSRTCAPRRTSSRGSASTSCRRR